MDEPTPPKLAAPRASWTRWLGALIPLVLMPLAAAAEDARPPNIVYIMADDLGYGDIQTLNPEHGKIPTPHADRLAQQGMVFTDSHSGSAVCTPTRYGLLTGRYSWRTTHQSGVVQGFAPCLIAEDRPTVAGFLQDHGYHTAIIGKWHLNNEYQDPDTGQRYTKRQHKTPPIGAVLPDGPVDRGFDYFHGFHHAGNMEAVIENNRVIAHDPPINMLPRLTREAVAYIDARAGDGQPFFLYVPLGSPHSPIVPTEQWRGQSGLGDYGDFVMQTDHAIGQISNALERHGLADNTLIIFTSDNGTSRIANIPALARQGHRVSAHFRGSKADAWEGGHRVPFIVRWPGVVEPGSTSDQLICHTDLFATVGQILGQPLPEAAAEDSVSFLPALLGQPIVSTRAGVIHHSISGHFAYRQGPWKLILARGSGGWTSPKENQAPADAPPAQLYNMETDASETTNLYLEEPEIAQRLLAQLESDIANGRSTAGPPASNDTDDIVLWKSGEE